MKRSELHSKIGKLLYLEDYGSIDIVLASMIANKLELGDPVWLMLIGASSGGKSQIMRPIANADTEGTRRVDDLTENTFISGQNTEQNSLLFQVGEPDEQGRRNAILLVSDMTVIFSKGSETRNAILSQFRMLFDGEFTKFFGNRKPVTWKGNMGVIAGSTPSAYRFFSEVADMGERFIYYRLPEPDYSKASDFVNNNMMSAKQLDDRLTGIYEEYLKSILRYGVNNKEFKLPASTHKLIRDIALCGTKFRTPVHVHDRLGVVDEIPTQEAPYRVMKQLSCIARAFHIMHQADGGDGDLPEDLAYTLKWCAYSLASDKRREIYNAVINLDTISIRNISAYTGLDDAVLQRDLAELSAIKVIKKMEDVARKVTTWETSDIELENLVRSLKLKKKDIVEENIDENNQEEVW